MPCPSWVNNFLDNRRDYRLGRHHVARKQMLLESCLREVKRAKINRLGKSKSGRTCYWIESWRKQIHWCQTTKRARNPCYYQYMRGTEWTPCFMLRRTTRATGHWGFRKWDKEKERKKRLGRLLRNVWLSKEAREVCLEKRQWMLVLFKFWCVCRL